MLMGNVSSNSLPAPIKYYLYNICFAEKTTNASSWGAINIGSGDFNNLTEL